MVLENYEKSVENWLKTMNWGKNPFILNIEPSLFVGYEEQLKKLVNHIEEGHKVALITGATGSGKTTLLKLIEEEFSSKYVVFYVSKPPKKDELVDLFLSKFKPSLLERLFHVNVRLHTLPDYVNKKNKRKILFLLDEAHEANIEVLEWLRTISDQVENMQIILAGLPVIEDMLRKNLETLQSRIVTRITLTTLTREDTRELIKKRIESVGGEDIKPFTEECVDEIYRKTGGFPREVLKFCDRMVQDAINRGVFVINTTESVRVEGEKTTEKAEEIEEPPEKTEEGVKEEIVQNEPEKPLDGEFLRSLPYKQRKIISILSDAENLYPSEIAEKIGFDKYKSRQHAVRSVNNILKRLMSAGLVERKPKGKGFVYFLSIKVRNVMVKK